MGDARAAVSHLRESTDHHRVAIAGYSFGAAVALGLALEDPSLTHVILIAPPTNLFDFSRLRELQKPVLVVAGHRDPWVDRVAMADLVQQAHDGRWEVIAGADHVFSQGLTELGKVVVRWMDQQRL